MCICSTSRVKFKPIDTTHKPQVTPKSTLKSRAPPVDTARRPKIAFPQ